MDKLVIDRPSPRARLPRRQRQGLRRPRQLRSGRPRAADLPRNRVRQGGKDPRHGNDLRHDRQDRRGSARNCSGCWACRSRSELRGGRTENVAKTSMKIKQAESAEVLHPRLHALPPVRPPPLGACASTASAVSASESWPTRARSPVSARPVGKPGKERKEVPSWL